MTDLESYVLRADDPEKKKRLRAQWSGAVEDGAIRCCCGLNRALEVAFRCLYCGEWYCSACAEIHFGQTVQEWIEKKRIERRASCEIELSSNPPAQIEGSADSYRFTVKR